MTTVAREHEGIPTVSSSAERLVRFPSPTIGQKVLNLETKNLERYDGTGWVADILGSAGLMAAARSAKAGTVSGNAKIGSRTSAPLVFTAATEVAGVLSTTKADVRGSATEVLTIEYTTDGSGVLTNGFVIVELRPRPLARDLGLN
jgi:hypothetical protein